jgi:hypothetical protein
MLTAGRCGTFLCIYYANCICLQVELYLLCKLYMLTAQVDAERFYDFAVFTMQIVYAYSFSLVEKYAS